MTRKIIFAVLAVLAIASFAIPGTAAMECNDGKMAIMSPSDRIACVTEKTFEKLMDRGWIKPTTISLEETLTISENTNVQTPNKHYSPASSDPSFEGQVILDKNSITATYTQIDEFSYADGEVIGLIYASMNIELQNDNEDIKFEIIEEMVNTDETSLYQYTYIRALPDNEDLNQERQATFVITSNGPLNSEKDVIIVMDVLQKEAFGYYAEIIDSDVILTKETKPFDWNLFVPIVSENYKIFSELNKPITGQTEHVPSDYIENEGDVWELLAGVIRYNLEHGYIANVTGAMLSDGLSQKFIDDYFKVYPEFRTQSFDGASGAVSGAQGAPTQILYQGNSDYENILVCVYEYSLNNSNQRTLQYNGITAVCDFTNDNGSYSIPGFIPTSDSRGISIGFSIDNSIVKLTNDHNDVITAT